MNCSKIGGTCPHPIDKDNNSIFVMMPFKDTNSIYDSIKLSVEKIKGKKFKCERADSDYTNTLIWCARICQPIRKAKYCIVDTTGKNPNVFYELGFSHATLNTKTIIITQNIDDAPFDVKDLGHIQYSEKDLPELRKNLTKAILDLEKNESPIKINLSSEELIFKLKKELIEEEERSTKFKNQLKESEERELKLKNYIKEFETIQKNPGEEAIITITELEKSVAEYKSKLKFTEIFKTKEIEKLKKAIILKEGKLRKLENEFSKFKVSNNGKALSNTLLIDTNKRAKSEIWFKNATIENNPYLKIKYLKKAIGLNPEYWQAYLEWGWTILQISKVKSGKEKETLLKEVIEKFQRTIEINPQDDTAYNNLGWAISQISENKIGKEKERLLTEGIQILRKALKINPQNYTTYLNMASSLTNSIETKPSNEKDNLFNESIENYRKSLELEPNNRIAYNNWGWALTKIAILKPDNEKENLFNESIEKYRKSLELEPNYSVAYNNWGWTLSKLAKLKFGKEKENILNESIKKFEKALEINSQNAIVYCNWGRILKELTILKHGNEKIELFEESIDKYRKAKEITQEDILPFASLAELYIVTNDYSKAENELKLAFTKTKSIKDITILCYLDLILKKILGLETNEIKKRLNKYLKKDFIIEWSCEIIEAWIKEADITEDQREYIMDITEKVKQKTK